MHDTPSSAASPSAGGLFSSPIDPYALHGDTVEKKAQPIEIGTEGSYGAEAVVHSPPSTPSSGAAAEETTDTAGSPSAPLHTTLPLTPAPHQERTSRDHDEEALFAATTRVTPRGYRTPSRHARKLSCSAPIPHGLLEKTPTPPLPPSSSSTAHSRTHASKAAATPESLPLSQRRSTASSMAGSRLRSGLPELQHYQQHYPASPPHHAQATPASQHNSQGPPAPQHSSTSQALRSASPHHPPSSSPPHHPLTSAASPPSSQHQQSPQHHHALTSPPHLQSSGKRTRPSASPVRSAPQQEASPVVVEIDSLSPPPLPPLPPNGSSVESAASPVRASDSPVAPSLRTDAAAVALDEEPDVCCICLDEYSKENPMFRGECKHHFHLSCLLEWKQRSNSCPMCCAETLQGVGELESPLQKKPVDPAEVARQREVAAQDEALAQRLQRKYVRRAQQEQLLYGGGGVGSGLAPTSTGSGRRNGGHARHAEQPGAVTFLPLVTNRVESHRRSSRDAPQPPQPHGRVTPTPAAATTAEADNNAAAPGCSRRAKRGTPNNQRSGTSGSRPHSTSPAVHPHMQGGSRTRRRTSNGSCAMM